MADYLFGVIEGFYGRTWPWPARRDMVRFLGEQGFNSYIYAPKLDRQLRRAWRESHGAAHFEALLALRAACRRHALSFGIGFSPWGLQSEYGEPERSALRARFEQLKPLECNVICVLFDDMPGNVADLARRQAQIVADISAFSGAGRVLMCPTYYSFDPQLERLFGTMPPAYLETLGVSLPPEVDILWTGPLVVSPGFSRADIDAVAARIGRRPVLWDNYPVNDGRKISRYLHLLPPRGRPAQLREWCAGHLANPMNQPYLSQLPLAVLARGCRVGDGFDADADWRAAGESLFGPELAALLRRDAQCFQFEGLDVLSAERRHALIDEYRCLSHPAAQEVVEWLGEAYRFDPECLND